MRPRLIAALLLMVFLPLGLLAWLGVRTAHDEQQRVQQRMQKVLTARLSDIRDSVARHMETTERNLAGLASREYGDPDSIRELIRSDRLVRQLFILQPDGTISHPSPANVSLTRQEREFLFRVKPVLDSGERFTRSAENVGASSGTQGWYTWFWGDGLQFIFWLRRADGRTVGIELENVVLLSDIVGLLPLTDSSGKELPPGRIVLTDAKDNAVYQWGDYQPVERELPVAVIPFDPPLNSWSLEYYVPGAEFGRGISGSAVFNLLSALGVAALALLTLAFYFYRESVREIHDAARKVSFVNQVSHELKTPLTNIRMYAELLEQRLPEDDDKSRGYLGVVISESRRLSRLIDNVLTFAGKRKAGPRLHISAGSVDETISRVYNSFRPAFQAAGVEAVFDAGAGGTVGFDADVIGQIIGNLLGNVEKYAVAGKFVKIESRQVKDQTIITVADHGPGIPRSQAEHIFKPFVRLSNKLTDGVAGTGIGLTIARDLARLHGGDLTLEQSATGASFRVVLQTPGAG